MPSTVVFKYVTAVAPPAPAPVLGVGAAGAVEVMVDTLKVLVDMEVTLYSKYHCSQTVAEGAVIPGGVDAAKIVDRVILTGCSVIKSTVDVDVI